MKECVWKSILKIDPKSTEYGFRRVPEAWLGPPWDVPGAGPARFLDAAKNR